MSVQDKVSVIIPAYNEAEGLQEVLPRILAVGEGWEIIVVDDGSEDATSETAEQFGVRVVRHAYNLGNGASVKSGALASSGNILVFMDADGQHPPERIPDLLREIEQYDMVVAARTSKSRTHWLRNIGNSGLKCIAQLITGREIADLTSGFRAVRRKPFMEFMPLFPQRYSYPSTITIAMMRSGYFVQYLPVDEICQRESGTSNISPLKDGLRFVNIILRLTMMFSPQRLLLPIAVLLFGVGCLGGVLQLLLLGGVHSVPLGLMLSGVIVFLQSLVAQQVVMARDSLMVKMKQAAHENHDS